nr:MAG TPA: hypothetical protein [Caudoviricetes sp.]
MLLNLSCSMLPPFINGVVQILYSICTTLYINNI